MVPTQLQALVVALLADVLAQVCGSQPWASSNDSVDLCAHGQELCGIRSHSGLVPVPRGGSLFYWYFVPPSRNSSAPLVLFLQGGPGAPSMFSVLWEMGPVTLDGRASLLRRPSAETWASEFPLLFVDSPVGTGWSSASGPAGLATSQAEVAGDLVAFLDAFAALHPEAPTDLVVVGESYGGHFVPALCAALLDRPGPGRHALRAAAVGNGFTDPPTQVLTKPQEAFAFGMIDERQLLQATKLATEAHDLALAGSYVAAAKSRAAMEELVINASGLNPHDVRTTEGYDRINDLMQTFFDLNETKDMLHIPRESKFTSFSKEVHDALMSDIMRSQQHNVEKMLLAGIRVLLYQGQFDWKDGVVANEAWIRSMQWPGIAGYLQAERMIWRRAVDGNVAGYWRRFKNLEQVVVLGAGHMVPMNQPLSALDMIQRFVRQRQPAERPAAATSRGTVLV